MPLTRTSYSMLNGSPSSVLDFGAKGDGVTDDTAAIQNAITECLLKKKNLFFPSGTYLYKPNNTFTINLLTALQSFGMFGEGPRQSIIKIDYNGRAFNVNNYFADGRLYIDRMAFELVNPSTNNNATCFYFRAVIAGLPQWGASWTMTDCEFRSFTNSAIHGVEIFQARTINCRFYGNSPYSSTSGLLTTYDDSCVRMWGADGTATLQAHTFSNQCLFQNCSFSRTKFGFDGWNAYNIEFDNCTFEPNWIGLINRPVPSAPFGINTSTEKGGGEYAAISYGNSWFEENALYHVSNVDVNNSGADVNPNKISQQWVFGSIYSTAPAAQSKKMVGKLLGTGVVANRLMSGTSILTEDPNFSFFSAFTNNPDAVFYNFTASEMLSNVPVRFTKTSQIGGDWDGAHPIMRNADGNDYHLWVDSSGKLRIKLNAPASDTDGTVVGTQT